MNGDQTRISIVDDGPIFVEVATCALRAASDEVDSAADAAQAIAGIPAFQP